jgi:anti-anti-sigma factor
VNHVGRLSVKDSYLTPDRVRLEVTGAINLTTGPELEAALLTHRAAGREVILDLSRVESIDSVGIAVLIRSVNDARHRAWSFSVGSAMSPAVASMLDASGLRSRIPVADP